MNKKTGLLRFTILSVGALCVLIISCATSGGSGSIPQPTKVMANNAGANVSLQTLNNGYEVFLRSCSECHKTVPKAPKDEYWHPEPFGSKLYSSLSAADRYSVIEYVRGVENRWFKIDTF